MNPSHKWFLLLCLRMKCLSVIIQAKANVYYFPTMIFIPREARRAEGPPSVARFINLSRGDRARNAKGGQISICPYIFRWCPHSCLATKPNRDRWQLRTLMFLRRVSSFLACFATYIYVLIFLFIVCEQVIRQQPLV